MATRLADLPQVDEDIAFGIMRLAQADKHPDKTHLSTGVYRDEEGKPWVLPSVRKAKSLLQRDPADYHEYSPIRGYQPFLTAARQIVLGDEDALNPAVVSIQTIGGTGANHMAAQFISEYFRPRNVWFSSPTWVGHSLIWERASHKVQHRWYPYFKPTDSTFDFDGMTECLKAESTPGDVVILHAAAHSPTGLDPTQEQWTRIADLCIQLQLFPLFDSAYQGFATGHLEKDGWAVKHFLSRVGLEMGIAQSFSKNFGLYGERVGALHIKTNSIEICKTAASLLEKLARSEITCPPLYGAKIVATIVNDKELFAEWERDLVQMSSRIVKMRQELYQRFLAMGTLGAHYHSGLTPEQSVTLREEFHIYLLDTGRIAITGLTMANVGYVARSIDIVVQRTTEYGSGEKPQTS